MIYDLLIKWNILQETDNIQLGNDNQFPIRTERNVYMKYKNKRKKWIIETILVRWYIRVGWYELMNNREVNDYIRNNKLLLIENEPSIIVIHKLCVCEQCM